MSIPLHTFEFEGSNYLRYPAEPWKTSGLIPDVWFAENVAKYLYSPAHIVREAEPYLPSEGPWASGLYFLLLEKQILYVGKSVEIMRRLNEHREKGWRFNRYWCFGGIPELYIEFVEAFYIHAFEPPLNEKYPILHSVVAPLVTAARARHLENPHA